MSLPQVVSREEWLAAREQLLVREKELTRQRDALNADRRRLPMVRIDKDYVFEGQDGKATLPDLFGDSSQLIIYHLMYDPAWENACPGCTAAMDEWPAALTAHLRVRDTAFAAVSRAPYAKVASYAASRGWTFPWYSSYGSDFNYDFHVTLDAAVAPVVYNYRTQAELAEQRPGLGQGGINRNAGLQQFPEGFRRRLPHLLHLRARHRAGRRRRCLRPAGPDPAGPSGGVGGAEGTRDAHPAGRPHLFFLTEPF